MLGRRGRGVLVWVLLGSVVAAHHAHAQPAPLITEVQIEQEGRFVEDPAIGGLIETMVGEPLSMRSVRETLAHLTSLNRFEDVQVFQETAGAGIRLRYVLFPLHPVDRIEFRGELGLSEGELRQTVTDRFGAAPAADRAGLVAEAIVAFYRDRGHASAQVVPRIEATHDPDRATMVFEIQAGRQARIGQVEIEQVDGGRLLLVPAQLAVRAGDGYDNDTIVAELERQLAELRALGYYEARAFHTALFEPAGTATVRITVEPGPLVSVVFAGDPLPEADRERLVPVRAEGSADEDLLEDATIAIEDHLRALGYRDATATYARAESPGRLTITFTIARGARYVVDTARIEGDEAVSSDTMVELVRVGQGGPFVVADAGATAVAIRSLYRAQGFARATVQVDVADLSGEDTEEAGDRLVDLLFTVTEGPQTLVGSVAFDGGTAFATSELEALIAMTPGRPYVEVDVARDRDQLDLAYRNRGYDSVVIEPRVTLSEDDARAAVVFAIHEGDQVLVDRVIIVGNQRTSIGIIERELLLQPGQPLGYAARIESQQRLIALGLFRRVAIDELRHGDEPRRDVLVQVEEAPPTTIGFGGGIEGGTRLRPTGAGGQAEERFEVAPRGFFEVGRRNLWGKNRAVNLFARVSLRSRDTTPPEIAAATGAGVAEGAYGFNEYRLFGTYREPRVFNTRADLLVTGIFDQAIRSSFNFITREVRAETGLRLGQRYSVATRYAFRQTRLFDERFTEAEKPLIDRVFPELRTSKFSVSTIRDTRDDVIDPDAGLLLVMEGELAARALGSEVGFAKTFLQGFWFRRVPAARRIVIAIGARAGIAHGFRRPVVRESADGEVLTAPDGTPIVDVVQDLPASERFFAGGDTTVRGFSLDRLGTDATISPSGFPTGGNGLIVLNAELRTAVIGGIGAVGFVDAGNVFPRAADLDFGRLRVAAGFGLRYQSPVGPIRLDLGFKLDRRELAPGRLERRHVLHISLGQAF
ncbi:MAG: BamA/TamA family outer membrane protein [Acidobacteria bacterium]|nr:BamA/TamA family outer membrane protein [Acidobacteriota bacterium]